MNIENKLDISEFVANFKQYFARDKNLHIDGDYKRHFEFVESLSKVEFIAPLSMGNITDTISRLSKFAILDVQSIYEIVKIVRYFRYLQSVSFSSPMIDWISCIKIPDEIINITNYFELKKPSFRDDIDEKLVDIASRISHLRQAIISSYEGVLGANNLREYVIDRQIHYIEDTECILLRGGFNGVLKAKVIGRSSSGYFYVVPSKINDIRNKILDLEEEKNKIIFEYQKIISKILNKNLLFIKYINKEFDRFDHYQARVMFAKNKNLEFILPDKNSKSIKLNSFRHPALKHPVPLDISFDSSVMLITGVNAGGKTILLKSLLGTAYLAKYLIPLPLNAHKSNIGYFKHIIPILDDPQNIKNDISTFAGRMVEFSKLFHKSDLLIGVDEIELGTDSAEASSLFKAILDELMQKNKIIITTHHKKLAALMSHLDDVQMIATLYDEKYRRPTYRFLEGTIGKSYAFETARRYKIPHQIVENALSLHSEDEDDLTHLIEKNIELENDLKKKKKFLNKELKQVNKLKFKLLKDKKENKITFDTMIHSYERKYKLAIHEAQKAVKLKDKKEIHKQISNANKTKSKIKQHIPKQTQEFKVGDMVKYRDSIGEILSINKKKVVIECDGIRMTILPSDISISHASRMKQPPSIVSYPKPKKAFIKLDIHGLRVEEAEIEIENFLNDALLSGLGEVYIYHGIGSGILANFTKNLLDKHPSVVSHDDASIDMGGYGATVVRL